MNISGDPRGYGTMIDY